MSSPSLTPLPSPTSIGSPSSPSVPASPTDDPSPTVSSPTVSPTIPAYPSSTPATPPSPSSSSSPRGSASAPTAANPYPNPSTTTTSTPTPPTTTSTLYSSLVLTESSTKVYESSSIITSDGQVYTTQITVTTILNPGTVVNSSSSTTKAASSSSSNTGAIVGGVIGGIAALVLLGFLGYYLFNKKRRLKDEFDGNFDPLAVAHSKHSPHPSLGGGAAANAAGRPGNGTLPHAGEVAGGANNYPFASPPNQPLPPSHPQMAQYGQGGGGLPAGAMMALGAGAGLTAAAYNNENPQHQGHHRNPSNISSVSSGNYPNNGPPPGTYGGPPPHGYQGQPGQFGQYPQSQQYAQGHLQPSLSPTNTTSSGGQGYANYNNSQPYNSYAPPIGRGPSPGPSVGMSDNVSQSQYTSSSVAGGGSGGGVGLVGRTPKEMEAFGGNNMSLGGGGPGVGMPIPHVVNPDDGQDGPHQVPMPEPQPHQGPGYFGAQPNTSGAQNYYSPSAGSTAQPTSQSTKPGLITLAPSPSISLVQHQDGGRVETHVENSETPSEIPPAYDSLPDEIRR